jgi:cytochrome oxidase assembly protein ShyY1
MDSSIIPVLFLVTFILALALGIWQYRKARKARAEHHRSASAKANHEPRTADGPRPR